MAHTVTGKLNKPANTFQAGESTGFNVRIGVKYRDRKTGQDEWTNYSAVIFAKSPNQISFYQSALVEGAVVEVSAQQLKIDNYEGQNGVIQSIEMINAQLGYVFNPNQQAPQQQYNNAPQQNAPQGGYNQAPQQGGYQQQAPQQGGYAPQQQAPQMQGGYPNNR